jgi:hypothetical protein
MEEVPFMIVNKPENHIMLVGARAAYHASFALWVSSPPRGEKKL